jgi:hypothetical protein
MIVLIGIFSLLSVLAKNKAIRLTSKKESRK